MGAGLTGLGAAYRLARAGIEVTVLEESPRVGGLAASMRKDGWTFDYGPHRFHTKNRELLDEVTELMAGAFNVRHRKSSIRLNGRYFAYPLEAKNLLMRMSPFKSARVLIDYLVTVTRNKFVPRPDTSFEAWVVNRFGRALYDIYFGPYTEKLWGIHPTRISVDWASQRIALMNLWDVAVRLLFKRNNTPRTYQTLFYYPQKGVGQIAERFSAVIAANHGAVHTGTRVCAVRWKGNMVESVICAQDGREFSETADYFISTIPVTDLVSMSRPLPGKEITDAAAALRYRGIVFLFLMTKRPLLTDNHWIYCPEKKLLFTRLSEPKNFAEAMCPAGKSSVCVEINCAVGDALWNAPAQDVFKKSMDSFKAMGFLEEDDVEDYCTDRMSHAYPIYEIGYEKHVRLLTSFVHGSDNLITAGRQGLFRYGNMDHALDMGFLAAGHLLRGWGDASRIFEVADTKDYFG